MHLKTIFAAIIFLFISSFCPLQKYPKKEEDLIKLLSRNTNIVYDSGFWSKTIDKGTELMPFKKIIKTRDFVIKFHDKEEKYHSTHLEIDNRKIDVSKIYFWRTKECGTVSQTWYHIGDVTKFQLGNKSYINFNAKIYMCMGSGCRISYEFLYDLETKNLYAFDFVGIIIWADLNKDNALDFFIIADEDSNYPALRTKSIITAFTQDPKGTFRPMSDTLGKPYEIKYTIKRDENTDEEKGIKITKWHWFFEP